MTSDLVGTSAFYVLWLFYGFYCFSISALMYGDFDQNMVRTACMDGVHKELLYMFSTDYGGTIDTATIQPVGGI